MNREIHIEFNGYNILYFRVFLFPPPSHTMGRLGKNFISQQLSGWLNVVSGALYLFVFVDFSRFCIWIRLARPQPWQLGAEAAGRPCLWPHHHRIQYRQTRDEIGLKIATYNTAWRPHL